MKTYLLIIIGIFFTAIGLFFALLYLNLFSFGYTFFDYVYFISRRFECILFVFGVFLLVWSKHRKGD